MYRLRRSFALALTVPALSIGLLSYHSLHGYRAEAVLSGSMGNAMPTGSLAILKEGPDIHYGIGDIVSFRPPIPAATSVTHRIIAERSFDGMLEITTKGDANASPDPWRSVLGAVTGKVLFSIPYIGYAAAWLQHPAGFLVISLVTFFLCVVPMLLEAWQGFRPAAA